MVAKIISGKSLIGALNYNENKVKQGKAKLIFQNGYAKDLHLLNFYDKHFRLKELSARNERTKTNTVHISLNFAVGEKLTLEKLNQITSQYMEHIGFGNQPYLVYSHHDAGHPHVHIVSTNIKPSGERISLHNLGRTKSETARKLIEQQYGLIPATRKEEQKQESTSLAKVYYGKDDTKRAISNVVLGVTSSYKFTSLPELNAALGYYNVTADRGSKESRMYAKNGLLYWALDNKGKKVGIPIKASSIYGSPTLKNLEQEFISNGDQRKPYKDQLKDSIGRVMKAKSSQGGFKQALQAKGIDVVFRENEQNRLYGITYVDHQSKVVFNGSDLGKSYSAAALSEWFTNPLPSHSTKPLTINTITKASNGHSINENENNVFTGKTMLDDLLKSDFQDNAMSSDMEKNKRKKKRKRLST